MLNEAEPSLKDKVIFFEIDLVDLVTPVRFWHAKMERPGDPIERTSIG